jgi:hypothetical protein
MNIVKYVGNLFGARHVGNTPEAELPQYDSQAFYLALEQGIDEMKAAGVDRVVLGLQKSRFDVMGYMDRDYYPLETLTPEEREMIERGESYSLRALILYGDIPVIETLHRRHSMNDRNIEPRLRYITITCWDSGTEGLMMFAQELSKNGYGRPDMKERYAPESLREKIRDGIEFHRQQTD